MLMFDLLAVAWQADMTRVFSYMLNRDVSQRVYPEIDISEPHHAMSHHGKDAKKLDGSREAEHVADQPVRQVRRAS